MSVSLTASEPVGVDLEVLGVTCTVSRRIIDSLNVFGHEGIDGHQGLDRGEQGDAQLLVSLYRGEAAKCLFNARGADALDFNVNAEMVPWTPLVRRLGLGRELAEGTPLQLPFGREPFSPGADLLDDARDDLVHGGVGSTDDDPVADLRPNWPA